MKKLIYATLFIFALSMVFIGILPDTNQLKDIFGYISVFAIIVLLGYFMVYLPIIHFGKWNKRYQEEKKIRQEQKKKEKMEKWLASDDGQEYLRMMDEINEGTDKIIEDLENIDKGIKELKDNIKNGEA